METSDVEDDADNSDAVPRYDLALAIRSGYKIMDGCERFRAATCTTTDALNYARNELKKITQTC